MKMKGDRPRGRQAPSKPRPASGLAPEDEALWDHAKRTLVPLRRGKHRVVETTKKAHATPDMGGVPPGPDIPVKRASHRPSGPAMSTLRSTVHDTPPLATFERKRARRIASGRTDIDARLDLHGSRQAEAHQRLRVFLMRCWAEGATNVLVITGKGGPPARGDGFREWDQPDRGVLKRSVPLWLEQPELRAIVTSFRPAHLKHGGEGAFYVQLRRRTSRSER